MTTLSGVVLTGGVERERVRIDGDRLTFAPAAGWESGESGESPESLLGWITPGLVDVHCHLGLGPLGAIDEAATRAQADADVRAGVLLVRDAGSPADTAWIRRETGMPRLIRAGRHLARPKRYVRDYAHELDDPDDLPAAMAAQARAGDGWVKIVGDWIDRSDGAAADLRPLWTARQLREGVAAAHGHGARVMVHTFATETVEDLLDAGVDCIEHGTGMTPAQLDRAAEAGVAVTPTLVQIANFAAIADQAGVRYPRYAARMRRLHARRHEQVAAMHAAGVQILVGTDAGGLIRHGRIADEAAELVAAGVPAADVLAAATWAARTYLGAPGIAEGAPADVVVYPEDPRTDIGVLARPSAVFLRGRRVR
ncbi:amidohydrolase family protein [Pseudactinotalea sp. HY160]|uniref:amidohydrolase family protein n=1 Tax=Pseudactinotalea sp. HY160 TaxID=2654490 RepID=UPI00351BA481